MDLAPRDPAFAPVPASAAALPEINLAADGGDGILVRLLRRKLLFGAVFVTVLGAAAAAYYYLPPTYKAEATLTVTVPDQLLSSPQPGGTPLTTGDTADLESQSAVLSSPTLLRALMERPAIRTALLDECALLEPPAWKTTIKRWLRRPPMPSCEVQVGDLGGMVESLKSRLAVSTAGRSRILSVSFMSPSPAVAKLVADGIVQAYLDLRMREKQQPREKAIEWLREEAHRISERLKETEAQIEAFLHQQGVVRGQTASLASEQLTGLAGQISLAEAERAAAAGRMQQAQGPGAATAGVLGNRTVADVKMQLATLGAQIAQLSARYGSENPTLKELLEQRRTLEQLLAQETGSVNRSATADYQAATSRVNALRQQLETLKQEVRRNDDASTQVAALERQAATDRELYLDLTKNLNQLQTSIRLVTPSAQLVSWAELPSSVFFPKISVFALAGTLLATGLAAAAALLRDRADRTVRTVSGLQSASHLRVLAAIPHVSRIGREASGLVAQINRPSAFQEAIRALYAECLLFDSKRSGEGALRSILVTSSECGEGKTFTALSFAHFAAAAGKRVLVLECDLRRPGIGRSLSLPPKPGISDLLRGQAVAAEAIHRGDAGRPDILLAGRTAVDSAELLAGPRMADLLLWATRTYDLVVLDSPPCLLVPDARILAPSVDGVLCCAQWGRSVTDSVIQGAHEMQAAGGRVLGLVLDRVQETQYQIYGADTAQAAGYAALPGR